MSTKGICIRVLRIWIALLSAAMLSSCQSVPDYWQNDTARRIDREMSDLVAKEAPVMPEDVASALMPPMETTEKQIQAEDRFDIALNNATARKAFLGLVAGTQYSVIVHPRVTGQVSLNLTSVTVPEAMDIMRDMYGYFYTRTGNRFFVHPQGIQTRIFEVSYLNIDRKGISSTRVVSGELTRGGSSSSKQAAQGESSGANVQISTTTNSTFWKHIQESIKAMLGDKPDREVVVNSQAGLVVVRASAQELAMVERYLGKTQKAVNRQIVLEARIVEVELDKGYQAGVNWSRLGSYKGNPLTISQIGGGTALDGGVSSSTQAPVSLDPGSGLFDPSGLAATNAFGGVFSMALNAATFNGFVEALGTQGKVHVLSSPRVSTINNEKAVIKIGGDEFFVTGVTQNAVSSGSDTVLVPTVELTPFFSGIALDVTPQIDENNNVTMHIHPTISQVAQRTKSFVIGGDDFSLPLAISNIQESDNIVRAGSGQVIVIGGLMKEGTTDDNASVPLLGDIPILGNLFKHKRVKRIKKELVILVRATVIHGDGQWNNQLLGYQKRIGEMGR
ncbi:MAG: secretin N-terminal domain-containing protein [Gammaproteobacteria bacterium]|nr:secretin N-terminal domain-containing protein [Gammaproteobacteria bacterium]